MFDETTRTVDQRLEALEREASTRAEVPDDPKEPADFAGDKVGTGRYILGFLIAGPLGLLANYWARYYGWRGTWISIAIFIAAIALLLVTGSFETTSQTCYQFPDGTVRCQ